MTFKEKIVKLRKLKGLTQDEFASAVGVSRQAVYKWESGQSYPEVAKLLEMKVLFNISIDDLLDDNYEVIVPEKKKKKRLPKEVKREVEEKIEEAVIKETAKAEIIENESVEKEPVSVTSTIEKEEVFEEKAPLEEVAKIEVQETKEEVVIEKKEPKKEEVKESTEKKVGFFGRLFGRK